MQCCGSGMIYSGSGSSFEFSEFRIRINADQDPTHTGINEVYLEIIKKHLNFNQKEEFINYLPLSISYYSPTVQTVQNSQFYISALSLFAGSRSGTIIPDPDKSSGSATLHPSIRVCFLFKRHCHEINRAF